jgi:hypothetical protein
MNYVLFWFLVSAVVFAVWEGLSIWMKATDFRLTRVTLSLFGYWILPVSMIWVRRAFLLAIQNLNTVIEFPTRDYPSWIRNKDEAIFAINNRSAIIRLLLTFAAVVIFSLLSSHIFFQSFLANLISYIVGSFVFILGILGQLVIESLLGFLNEIEKYRVRLPVFRIQHYELLKLFQFYYRTALFIFVLVFMMLAFLLTTPFGTEFAVILLVSLTTFYPLALLLWSAYKIHGMMLSAKENHIDDINQQIQVCFERVRTDPSKENSESLDALLDVQKKISSELDWPIDVESVSALLVTFLIPSINFISTLWGKLSK